MSRGRGADAFCVQGACANQSPASSRHRASPRLASLRLARAVLSASLRFASAEAMPRLLVLCLVPRRRVIPMGLQPGRRLIRLEARRRQRPKLSVDSVVGLVVLLATLLVPCAFVLRNLRGFRMRVGAGRCRAVINIRRVLNNSA
uniref:uncharacterized protein LOC118522516 n=1 Tax=Halichoerus grypus TaxID=9711 RepID=UPI001658FABD|nr:uncharacterized protein LOC118522516 [Halichoerus grypus]